MSESDGLSPNDGKEIVDLLASQFNLGGIQIAILQWHEAVNE